MKLNKKKVFKILIILLIILVIIGSIYISIPLIQNIKNPDVFIAWIDSFGIFSPLVYILVTMLSIIVSVIPGEVLELSAGYAFGLLRGTLFCLIAESLGSFLVILLSRKYGIKLVDYLFDTSKLKEVKFFKSAKSKIALFAIIFIAPGTPKDILCYYAGLSSMDLGTVLLIASLGRLPSIITSTMVGAHLSEKNYKLAIIVFVITAIISLVSILIYNNFKVKKEKQN